MAVENMGRDRDLVLAPGEFAFVLDTTKGLVNVIVGPNKTSMSNTDQPVLWNETDRRFKRCEAEQAVQAYPNAPEGFYLVLANPVDGSAEKHPPRATSTMMSNLKMGRRVNIPGPTHFPLWPGQTAKVIEGHHLRSNQYLVVRVYNDEEARANWGQAVVKPQAQTSRTDDQRQSGSEQSSEGTNLSTEGSATPPPNLTMGQLMVIKGTDVAFFIPPTGIEVLPEPENGKAYVREAVTLERLEYCILLDEDGNKRYVQGPDVVFPSPTETFVTKDGNRKFRAIELNENSGIYVKVIAGYEDGDNTYKVGDELFITGRDQAIYFPREEQSIIKYGDQTIHYAVAVPAGEGRYVLDRNKGEVRLVKGPIMLLPDPRKDVIVRRFLATKTVALWYPNNKRVLEVNQELEALSKALPSGEYLDTSTLRKSFASPAVTAQSRGVEESLVADTFRRGTSYTPPRTVTLDTKYEGAVSVNVWTGYAVLIVNKTGDRRVVVGPQTILLEYDETLAPMELSTGTPKTDERLFGTVYLRVQNNKVSDIVKVETEDLVQVDVSLSYRVNFESDEHEKWFAVENYVRLLVDHLRSLIRNTAKHKGIEEFYAGAIDIIRDAVLGGQNENGKRPGRSFTENSMRVYDVEVLDVKIGNADVARMLTGAQTEALQGALQISKEERNLQITTRSEEIKQEVAMAVTETEIKKQGLEKGKINAQLEANLAKIAADATKRTEELKNQQAEQEALNGLNQAKLAREKLEADQKHEARQREIAAELKLLQAETEETVKRMGAVDDKLVAALQAFADGSLLEKMTEAIGPASMLSNVPVADILGMVLKNTPLESVMKQLGTRSRLMVTETPGNGKAIS